MADVGREGCVQDINSNERNEKYISSYLGLRRQFTSLVLEFDIIPISSIASYGVRWYPCNMQPDHGPVSCRTLTLVKSRQIVIVTSTHRRWRSISEDKNLRKYASAGKTARSWIWTRVVGWERSR